jgi:hypothetical protein
MKNNKRTTLNFKKQTITRLTEATVRGGFAVMATQSNQQQTGCQTNCQPDNKSFNC